MNPGQPMSDGAQHEHLPDPGDVQLASARGVDAVTGVGIRHAQQLIESRVLGPVYAADGARFVTADRVAELTRRPELVGPHPEAVVLRVTAGSRDPSGARRWVGWRADADLASRRAGVAGFWAMGDDYAARICEEKIPIIVTLAGYVVDAFAASGFQRVDGRVIFDWIEVDGAPFTGTVLLLGPGGAVKKLPACDNRRPHARGRRATFLRPS